MASPSLRQRRRRSSSCFLSGVLVLAATCAFSVTLKLQWLSSKQEKQKVVQRRQLEEREYPEFFIDLWPDDGNKSEEYRNTLLNCIPGYDDDGDGKGAQCQVRLQQQSNHDGESRPSTIKRVALARPPGLLGNIFVEFVTRVVNMHDPTSTITETEDDPIELVSTTESVIPPDHQYSMIIRLATLPVLLEASDVALTVQKEDSTSMEELSDLLRYSVRRQCHLTERTNDTALLTITLDRMIGYPVSTTHKIQTFLGLTPHSDPKNNRVKMEELPSAVMGRIDAASALVEAIRANQGPRVFQELDSVFEEEVKTSQKECRSLDVMPWQALLKN